MGHLEEITGKLEIKHSKFVVRSYRVLKRKFTVLNTCIRKKDLNLVF